MFRFEAAEKVALPVVRVPTDTPGSTVPAPTLSGRLMVPVPPSVPPLTVTAAALGATEPLTSRVPALTVTAPVNASAPPRVGVPWPTLVRLPVQLALLARTPS